MVTKEAKTQGDSGSNLVPRIRTNSVCAPVNYSKLIFGISQPEATLHPQNPSAPAPEAGNDFTSSGSQDDWQSLDPFTPPKSRNLQEAKPILGALLTYEQEWTECGIALGRPLKATTLAPGEVARFAVTNFGRASSGHEDSNLGSKDDVSSETDQSASVRNVQKGVSEDVQSGGSSHADLSAAGSSSSTVGLLLAGGSSSRSGSLGIGTTHAHTQDHNSISALGAKDINQKTAARSRAVRQRNCAQVRDVSENEAQSGSTRIVANYNHMHAMTMLVFEVVERYKIRTRVIAAERVIYIPMPVLTSVGGADDPKTIDFFEHHFDAIVSALESKGVHDARHQLEIFLHYHAVSHLDADAVVAHARDTVARLVQVLGEPMPNGDEKLELGSVTVMDWKAKAHAQMDENKEHAITGAFEQAEGFADDVINGISGVLGLGGKVSHQKIDPRKHKLYKDAEAFLNEIDLALSRFNAAVARKQNAEAKEIQMDHPVKLVNRYIEDVRTAILGSLSMDQVQRLLDGHSFAGQPLRRYLDPRPVGVYGEYIAFRFGFADAKLAEAFQTAFLDHEIDEIEVDLGSGATFGEAILGESISAEKIDLTRFWNWKDSMIPILPPEIDPMSLASRARGMTFDKVTFEDTITRILQPKLPDEDISALVARIGDKARDMSGQAEMNQRALAGLQTAQAMSADTGANAIEGMRLSQQFATELANSPIAKAALFAAFPEAGGATFAGGLMAAEVGAADTQGNEDETGPVGSSGGLLNTAKEALEQVTGTEGNGTDDGDGAVASILDKVEKVLPKTDSEDPTSPDGDAEGETGEKASTAEPEAQAGTVHDSGKTHSANGLENKHGKPHQTTSGVSEAKSHEKKSGRDSKSKSGNGDDEADDKEGELGGGSDTQIKSRSLVPPSGAAAGEIMNDGKPASELPTKIKATFRDGSSKYRHLPRGTLLYKFNHYPEVQKNVTEWWSEVASNEHDGGLRQRWSIFLQSASRGRRSAGLEAMRTYAGVSENWNSFQYLLVAKLLEDVFCHSGKIASQDRLNPSDKDAKKIADGEATLLGLSLRNPEKEGRTSVGRLVGNAGQVYIPDMINDRQIQIVKRFDLYAEEEIDQASAYIEKLDR